MPAPVDLLPLAVTWERVQERLHRAAQRAGRRPEDIEVVAVTKNQPVERMREAFGLGLTQWGESRVQEAAAKRETLSRRFLADRAPRWHLIGHLQSNKARRAVELFDCLQSVDSLKLAEILSVEGSRRGRPVSCLVEIKISREDLKQGVPPENLESFLEQTSRLPHLRVEGLMGLAPLSDDPAAAREAFRSLRRLFDRHRAQFRSAPPVLSMGMSSDFEVAVEEGSTMVRIGSALFGPRPT